MNRLSKLGLAAVCSVAAVTVALAQPAPPTPEQMAQNAVKTRKGLFDVQSFSFGPVGAMLRGAPFNQAAVVKAAQRVEFTAGLIPEVFQNDTRKFQVETKAREGIWTNKSDFEAKAKDLLDAATALETAAKTGDEAATKKAAGAVGKACGACHDQFRDK